MPVLSLLQSLRTIHRQLPSGLAAPGFVSSQCEGAQGHTPKRGECRPVASRTHCVVSGRCFIDQARTEDLVARLAVGRASNLTDAEWASWGRRRPGPGRLARPLPWRAADQDAPGVRAGEDAVVAGVDDRAARDAPQSLGAPPVMVALGGGHKPSQYGAWLEVEMRGPQARSVATVRTRPPLSAGLRGRGRSRGRLSAPSRPLAPGLAP